MGIIEIWWPDIPKKLQRRIFRWVEAFFLLFFLIIGIYSLLLIDRYIICFYIGITSIFIGILAIIIAEFALITKDIHLTPLEQIKSNSDTFELSLKRAKTDLSESKYDDLIPAIITELYNDAKVDSITIWTNSKIAFFGLLYLISFLTCLLYILEAKHGTVLFCTLPNTFWAHLYIVIVTMLSLGEGSLTFINNSEGQLFEIVAMISSFIYLMIFVSVIIGGLSSGGEKYYTAIRQFVWDNAFPPK